MPSRPRAELTVLVCVLAALAAGCQLAAVPFAWPQFGGDPAHTSANTAETSLSTSTVAQSRLLWQSRLGNSGRVDSAPVFVPRVTTPAGERDMVLATTTSGSLVATDWATGAQLWSRAFFASGPCQLHDLATQPLCYTTSAPAVSPDHTTAYSYGLDGIVHEVRLSDGSETPFRKVVTNKPKDEKGSSALALATAHNGHTYLYVASSGYPDPPGDSGDYQGHLSTFDLTDGTEHVFNTVCSDRAIHFTYDAGTDCTERMGAVWARPGVVYDEHNDLVYLTTGNATFDPAHHHWGDTVLALHADGTGNGADPVDSYTPTNFQALEDQDLDLGSTAPAILPVPAGSTVAHVGLQSGKDAKLRLLDLDDLSGQGGPGHTGGELSVIDVPQGGMVFSMPTVWVDPAGSTWTFVTNGSGTAAFKLVLDADKRPTLALQWQSAVPGSTPLLANGVLYIAGSFDSCFFCGNYVSRIGAYDPHSGDLLWKADFGSSPVPLHWQSPVVANGVLLISDGAQSLFAYGVDPTTAPGPPQLPTATPGVRKVRVQWQAAESAPGYPVTSLPSSGYHVVASPGGASCSWTAGPLECEVTGLDPAVGYTFTVVASNKVGVGPASVPTGSVHPLDGAGFTPVTPVRILDSRTPVGGWGGTPLVAGSPRAVHATGTGATPATVRAAVLNVTVTGSTADTYVSAWPAGAPPTASSLVNVAAGATIANEVTLATGAQGDITFASLAGATDLVVDLVGYYEDDAPAGFSALSPLRILDSRTTVGGWDGPLQAGAPRGVAVRTLGGVPPEATAVVANLTVTAATTNSFVSAYPSGQPSTSSAINFAANETIANSVTLPIGSDGAIAFANARGAVDVVVDVVGFYVPGGGALFHALTPVRILDDRIGLGVTGPWSAQTPRSVLLPMEVVPQGAKAVVLNLTVTNGSAASFLSVSLSGLGTVSSTMNFAAGQTIAHGTTAGLVVQTFTITNHVGLVDVVADLQGYFG